MFSLVQNLLAKMIHVLSSGTMYYFIIPMTQLTPLGDVAMPHGIGRPTKAEGILRLRTKIETRFCAIIALNAVDLLFVLS